MRKLTTLSLCAVSLLSLTACEEACTLEARTSVLVHLSDAEGAPLDGQVQFDAGDGPSDCYEAGEGTGDYACAYEIGGDLEILVSAEGYQAHSETVTVSSDVCHVLTEELNIILQPDLQE